MATQSRPSQTTATRFRVNQCVGEVVHAITHILYGWTGPFQERLSHRFYGRLVLSLDHGVHGGVELVAALEEGQADDEEVFEGDTAGLLDQLARRGGRAARGNQVAARSAFTICERSEEGSLNDNALLAGEDSVALHLKHVDAVLLLVRGLLGLSGKLAGLSDGHKGRTEPHGNDRAEEETPGVQADNHIRRRVVLRRDVVHEVGDQSLECDRVTQNREDVQEGDTLYTSVLSLRIRKMLLSPRALERALAVENRRAVNTPSWGSQGARRGENGGTGRRTWSMSVCYARQSIDGSLSDTWGGTAATREGEKNGPAEQQDLIVP